MTLKCVLKWAVIGVFGLAVLLVGVAVVQHVIVTAGTVYATPETQSRFLQTYSPDRTIAAFKLNDDSSSSTGQSSGSGQGLATYQRLFYVNFFIKSGDTEAISKALIQDASEQLLNSGAKIVSTENPGGGRVLLRYSSGLTKGEIVIEPLKIGYWYRPIPSKPPADRLPVTARVNIDEKYVPQ
ncbi:MAG TPA: hypothetical protein VG897_18165 [Terriglobales bacterium]|nr:hypothetical protein [Terriglobales bacterium]